MLNGSKSTSCQANVLTAKEPKGSNGKFFEVFSAPASVTQGFTENVLDAKVSVDIRSKFTTKLGLKGESLTFYIKVVNNKDHQISRVGIPSVTSIPTPPDLSQQTSVLRSYPKEIMTGSTALWIFSWDYLRAHCTAGEWSKLVSFGSCRANLDVDGC
jgi:hypothetical protein